MSENEKKENCAGVSRRKFIRDAGIVVGSVAIGSIALGSGVEARRQGPPEQAPVGPPDQVPVGPPERLPSKSGVIVGDASKCAGCGVCMMLCSTIHEQVSGLEWARLEVVRDAVTPEIGFNICQQCFSPCCYYLCRYKDKAMCIDEVTGARYINQDECVGCGDCSRACPFDPPGVTRIIEGEKRTVFKCDLCKDRDEGPACVEFCPMEALKFISKDER